MSIDRFLYHPPTTQSRLAPAPDPGPALSPADWVGTPGRSPVGHPAGNTVGHSTAPVPPAAPAHRSEELPTPEDVVPRPVTIRSADGHLLVTADATGVPSAMQISAGYRALSAAVLQERILRLCQEAAGIGRAAQLERWQEEGVPTRLLPSAVGAPSLTQPRKGGPL